MSVCGAVWHCRVAICCFVDLWVCVNRMENAIEMLRGIDVNNLNNVKAELLANPGVRLAYDAQAPEFELARELIAARTQAGLTQGDVAARMGTTQSVVARIESDRGKPPI